MAMKAGEKANKAGDLYCANCNEKVRAEQGQPIPKCPNSHEKVPDQT